MPRAKHIYPPRGSVLDAHVEEARYMINSCGRSRRAAWIQINKKLETKFTYDGFLKWWRKWSEN